MPLHRTAPAHPHTCIAQSIDPSTKQFAFHLGLSTPCPVPSTIETRGQIKHQHGTTIANSPVQTCPCLVLGSCFCFPLCSAQFNSTLPLLLYFLFFLFFIFFIFYFFLATHENLYTSLPASSAYSLITHTQTHDRCTLLFRQSIVGRSGKRP